MSSAEYLERVKDSADAIHYAYTHGSSVEAFKLFADSRGPVRSQLRKRHRTTYQALNVRRVWYDLDPLASDLWVVEGPPGYDLADIDPDNLPSTFRWVDATEWREQHANRIVLCVD